MLKIKHPVINKIDSKHYDSFNKEPTILRFEKKYSLHELAIWAKITAEKYIDPGRKAKGQEEADQRKYETYKNYYDFLEFVIEKFDNIEDTLSITAFDAYEKFNIKLIY